MTIGVILGGGSGSRLYPTTKLINKHFLNVYNKPMIYYPLSILILNKIKDIIIVCNEGDLKNYNILFGNGKKLGIKITYSIQENADGISGALMTCEKYIKKKNFLLMLGDNFFYGNDLIKLTSDMIKKKKPTLFSYNVSDHKSFGIIEYKKKAIKKIHEKPVKKFSSRAVVGMYYLNKKAFEFIKMLKKSKRGEYEITDLLNMYFKKNLKLNEIHLGRGITWFDMGSYDDFINASSFIKIIEERQNLKIGSVEQAAKLVKFIK